jgi:uncharacterized protein (TIGR02271 family)
MAMVNPENLVGLRVTNAEGERLGKVTHVFYDALTQAPEWIGVKVGGFFNGGAKVIPLQVAQVRHDTIIVPYTRDFVMNGPEHWTTDVLTTRDKSANVKYYNIMSTPETPPPPPPPPSLPDSISTKPTEPIREPLTGEYPHPLVEPPVTVDPVAEPVVEEEVIRSEEELRVGKETVETGKVRIEKTVVTEPETVSVPVSHEEVVIERHPIDPVVTGTEVHPESHEMTLHEERPVIGKETVAKERVRVRKEVVDETAVVAENVRKENVHVEQRVAFEADPLVEPIPGEIVTDPTQPPVEPPVVVDPAPGVDPLPGVDEPVDEVVDPVEPPIRPVDPPLGGRPPKERPVHPLGKEKKAKAPKGRLPREER